MIENEGESLSTAKEDRAREAWLFLAPRLAGTTFRTVPWLRRNSDTGKPVIVDDSRLTVAEFEKVKIAETIQTRGDKSCRPFHSPLWQADPKKIRRMAPIEFIGRCLPDWFDYAICDEIQQLAGDTAQGNALGTLSSCTDRIVGLTGTLLGGYADDCAPRAQKAERLSSA